MGDGCWVGCEHALAVANHPYLTAYAAEDDDRCCQTVFRVLGQTLHHRLLVMLSNRIGHTSQELFTCYILGHAGNVTADELHGISSVRPEQAVMIVRFRGTAINDSNEVICYDDSVLAFLLGILGDESLLYYFHRAWGNKGIILE